MWHEKAPSLQDAGRRAMNVKTIAPLRITLLLLVYGCTVGSVHAAEPKRAPFGKEGGAARPSTERPSSSVLTAEEPRGMEA
jgi:hypothetical protein